jgi:nicotinate dehydrogenase subunit B
MPEEAIHAIHVPGPGCYGHNGADDAALDAALLARAVPGRPISLKWMREDEHKWEPYGTATVLKLQGSLDGAGNVVDWNHDVWAYAHSARASGVPGSSSLLASWYLEDALDPPQPRPSLGHQSGIHRNAEPLYAFPRKRIVKYFLPENLLRVSALRGLGYYANAFAIESFMDELAHAAGLDPVAFRLRYLKDERARAVIEAAVEKAGRPHPARADARCPSPIRMGEGEIEARVGHLHAAHADVAHAPLPDGMGEGETQIAEVWGRGVAFAQYKNRQSYVAVVVDLTVDRSSGRIALKRAVLAADSGQIVNPDGLSNQLEGGVTQAASWALKERVRFGAEGITSVDWATYPILRFHEIPEIETVLINRPGMPFLGIGEGTHGPVPAAIANAVFDAIGVRLRQIPFTPERVKAAIDDVETREPAGGGGGHHAP